MLDRENFSRDRYFGMHPRKRGLSLVTHALVRRRVATKTRIKPVHRLSL